MSWRWHKIPLTVVKGCSKNTLKNKTMKALTFLPIVLLLVACKSYMEYTAGIKELDYSFDNTTLRRFYDMETAIRHPEKVVFLDVSFATTPDPGKLYKDLNENLLRFPNLKKLTLDGNDKYPVPEPVFQLTQLEFLALSSFKDSLSWTKLDALQNLRFLSLDFCGLKTVPPAVLSLKKLQGLDLTGNEIAHLPEETSGLTELITLDLTNNSFTEIPLALKNNPKLKYIDLNNAEGTNRGELRSYQVGVNKIRTVPDLTLFPSLKELYVTYAYEELDSLSRQYANVKIR